MTFRWLPNAITIARIVSVALLLWLIAIKAFWPAMVVLLLCIGSDWIDGWLARRLQATSHLGAWLDPLADKVLVVGLYVYIWLTTSPAWWLWLPMLIIMARELGITVWRLVQAAQSKAKSASWAAKVKTTCQLISLVLWLLVLFVGPIWVWPLALSLWIAAILSLTSAWGYLVPRKTA